MTSTTIDPSTTTVGQMARRFPGATRIFESHRIEYCCGGDRLLSAACAEAGIEPDALIEEIMRDHLCSEELLPDWESVPVADLCRHIVSRYHRSLTDQMRTLPALAAKVAAVHGDKEPRLRELSSLVKEFADEIEAHMQKEEKVLFPMICAGADPFTPRPVACMRREHDEHGGRLARMAALSDGFVCPAQACASWRALCDRLRALQREMKEHINLENNVLFPRALEAVARAPRSMR